MKNALITICLLFTYVIFSAGNPPERDREKSNANYSTSSYQLMTQSRNYIYPEWGFYIGESTGYSMINNNNLSSDLWNLKGGLGFNFDAGYFRTISPYFRVIAGLGFSYYSNILRGDGIAPTKQLSDIDNDKYTETLTLSNIKNKVNPVYISIPLVLEYGNININKTGFFVNAGIKYSFLLYNNYQPGGTYSTKGTYEQWGVTLENIDELGYYSDRKLESDAEFKKSNLSVLGGFGIAVPVSSVVIIKLGITGSLGLIDIGNNRPVKDDVSPITVETYNFRTEYINNTLAVNKGTKTRFVGFELGIYINKRLK